MDRQINGIKREEQKVTRSIKEAAKRGDKDVCRWEEGAIEKKGSHLMVSLPAI